MLLSALQFPVAKYLYDPFGNTLSSSGPLADANFYRFSSKELHVNSGLSYYLYRYYAPGLQRWINRDPISDLGFARVRKAGFIPAKSGRSNTPLARRIMSDPHLLF